MTKVFVYLESEKYSDIISSKPIRARTDVATAPYGKLL